MNRLFFVILFFLHLFLSITALIGGFLLMLRPDGYLIQMDLNGLQNSPFSNFLVPGLLLFVCVGLLSLITCCGLLLKFNWKVLVALNIYKDRFWAWSFSLYSGISTILWISIQLILTQYFWLQPVIIIIGLGILICTLIPGIMKQYEKKNLNR